MFKQAFFLYVLHIVFVDETPDWSESRKNHVLQVTRHLISTEHGEKTRKTSSSCTFPHGDANLSLCVSLSLSATTHLGTGPSW